MRRQRYLQVHNYRHPQEVAPLYYTSEDREGERDLYPGSPRRSPRRHEGYTPSFGETDARRGYRLTEYERTKGFPDGRPPLFSHEDLDVGHPHDGGFSQRSMERGPKDTERKSPVNASLRKVLPWERDMGDADRDRKQLEMQQKLEQLQQESQSLQREIQELKYQRDMEKEKEREADYRERQKEEERRREMERYAEMEMESKRRAKGRSDSDQGRLRGYGQGQMTDTFSNRMSILRDNSGGALLFLRFPAGKDGENVPVAAKACVMAKTSDMGGSFVGIADQVFNYRYNGLPNDHWVDKRGDGCLVFHFRKLENAKLFYECDHRFRQQDFPPPQGCSEVFALSVNVNPQITKDFDTFLMHQLNLTRASMDEYEKYYVQPMTDLLKAMDALPFVAHSKSPHDREPVHRFAFGPKAVVTLHIFKNWDRLARIRENEEYRRLTAMLCEMAEVKGTVFTIKRDACP